MFVLNMYKEIIDIFDSNISICEGIISKNLKTLDYQTTKIYLNFLD